MRCTITVVSSATAARTDVVVSVPQAVSAERLGSVIAEAAGLRTDDRARLVTLLDGDPVLHEGRLFDLTGTAEEGPPSALMQLQVVGGPSAGGVRELRSGATLIGRSPECDLPIEDASISRRHALVRVSADGVTIADIGSSNGTYLDNEPVERMPVSLEPDVLCRIGDSTVVLVVPDAVPATTQLRPDGMRSFNRPPRLLPRRKPVRVAFPDRPSAPDAARLSLVAAVVPLAMSAALAVVLRRPEFLLFALLTPALMGGQWLSDRLARRRAARADAAEFSEQREAARHELVVALRGEEQVRRHAAPDAATIALVAAGPLDSLWERRRTDVDFLHLRLGLGEAPAGEVVVDPSEPLTVRDVPLCVPLPEVGVLGIAGPLSRVVGLARFLVCQAAVLHSPRDVDIVLLTTPERAQQWEWVRWLPHVRPGRGQPCTALIGTDPETAAARVAELNAGAADGTRTLLVLVDGARELRNVPGMADLLARPAADLYAICLDVEIAGLPEECRAVAVVDGDTASRLTVQLGDQGEMLHGVVDATSEAWAEQVARALSPLRDDTPGAGTQDLPAAVRWASLVEAPDDPAALAAFVSAAWDRGPTMEVALGVSADGPFRVDLIRDGPHALVAGTTGSGKSEFLRSLVVALSAANSPEDLSFVLIDYKGGAAFGACASLPHAVGVVTDLDRRLTERALIALDAELKRREQLFASVGAQDVHAYRSAGRRLGRLAIVVDEFATLAEELPDFVRGLVGVAQRGRSLGVHLILATQRPEGVVSADIRANANLRICLAVTRETESRDLIDSPAAAHISRLTPGRALARTGHAELRAFQAAHVGVPAIDVPDPIAELSPFHLVGKPPPSQAVAEEADQRTDLEQIVAACRSVAHERSIVPPASPWLPPLPERIVLPKTAEGRVPWAMQDLPRQQAQALLHFDLDDTAHLLIVGTARSGRTTALRTLAASMARATPTNEVHIYGIDGAGGLRPLAGLPHCGAVLGLDELPLLSRMLGYLASEVSRRQALLAENGCAGLGDLSDAADGRLPHLVLLIDGWEAFAAVAHEASDEALPEAVYRLLRDGAAVGVHVIITAERSGLAGRLPSAIADRLVLRLADRGDYPAAGIPTSLIPDPMPPGRGIWVDGAVETHVCLLADEPGSAAQLAALAAIAGTCRTSASGSQPRRFDPPPERIYLKDLKDLKHAAATGRGGSGLVIGVCLEQAAPVRIDLDNTPGFVVSGPPRSGRSNALAVLTAQLHECGRRPLVVATRASPLRTLAEALDLPLVHNRGDATPLHAPIGERSDLVIDDVELITSTPVGDALDRLVRDGERHWIVAGATEDLAIAYRGFPADVRRSRCGLLLGPHGPMDGEALGIRLPRQSIGSTPHPGRGFLAMNGSLTAVQVVMLT